MPPGPAYNWLCVAHSVYQVLENAAQYRASQLARTSTASQPKNARPKDVVEEEEEAYVVYGYVRPSALEKVNEQWLEQLAFTPSPVPEGPYAEAIRRVTQNATMSIRPEDRSPARDAWVSQIAFLPPFIPPALPFPSSSLQEIEPSSSRKAFVDNTTAEAVPSSFPDTPAPSDHHADISSPATTSDTALITPLPSDPSISTTFDSDGSEQIQENPIFVPGEMPLPENISLPQTQRTLQSSAVPSSRIGRLFHYGGLAASLGYGAASELLRRSSSSSGEGGGGGSLMLTEANVNRLVSKLSKMRGAALKLGQFMSIQDTHVLPPEVDRIFRRVQDSAHYMPNWQMEQVLSSALGSSWRSNFLSFEPIPFAAASIGQVHRAVLDPAVLASSPVQAESLATDALNRTEDGGIKVAVKVQFPNIRRSVESDLGYVKALLTAGSVLPKGLFLERTIKVMKEELADECDYAREASFLRSFGLPERLGNDPRFKVPWVWEGSTDTVLVMERVDGVSLGEESVGRLEREEKNEIASRIIELCLKELFVFKEMQTDPNWSNFLWNERTKQIELVDFGATRSYTDVFMDDWLRLLNAAAEEDVEGCREWSLKLGYLTGEESETMLAAHIKSMTLLATPFRSSTLQPFAFGPGTQWQEITREIREQIPVMLKERLTPPPRETYSLNRKLSGAFLLASRLGARVDCKKLWDGVVEGYKFSS